MRKLKIIEHISLDGVIQVSGDDGDFPYGDWTAPYRTPACRDAMLAAHGERFDLLLGRRTYDSWSGFWPKAPSSPMADRLNAATNRRGARDRPIDTSRRQRVADRARAPVAWRAVPAARR
jgi:dihydrofolate reductase